MGEHYERAPIAEALLDIRVELSPSVTVQVFDDMHAEIASAYPDSKQQVSVVSKFAFGAELSTETEHSKLGLQMRNPSTAWVCQARLDGFTLSRLEPYTTWDEFRAEAYRLWQVYKRHAQVERVIRIALRYINKLKIPLPIGDFRDYLRTVPDVSADLPQQLQGCFMHLVIPLEGRNTVILNQAIEGEPVDDLLTWVLDIDVFQQGKFSEDEIWAVLDEQRTAKNRVFEACITDRVRRLIS